MARMGTATRNTAEKHALIPTTTYYLSLHTTDPGTTGAHEISGTGSKLIKYVGIWTLVSTGVFKWGGAMAVNRTVATIGSYARQAVTFGTPTNGKAKNKAKITFVMTGATLSFAATSITATVG